MKITTPGIIIIFIISIASIFLANIISVISVNFDFDVYNTSKKTMHEKLIMTDSYDHLVWIVQVSDIHISIFHDSKRISDLRDFCDFTISTIKPSLVLATGDLTDAKQKDNVGSRQYIGEWKSYREILDNCKSLKDAVWLDIRGNHDNFNVPGFGSAHNLYRNYSNQGRMKSYSYNFSGIGEEVYKVIGVDACPEQGLRRPFNFIGILSEAELTNLRNLASEGNPNYTLWFGHYPTSCILSPKWQLRDIISDGAGSLAYLCGHLHTLGGLVPQMYTRHKHGFLELELGDWKDNRKYRILAVDHGLLSFIDVHYKEWPIVLITNPKNSLFSMPSREPLERIPSSTHIRVLVFSRGIIKNVKARVDMGNWEPCRHVEGPLYVLPWEPTLYTQGIHHVQVSVLDEDNVEKLVTQQFSLDGSSSNFSLLARIFLMSNMSAMFQMLFGFAMVGCILPLCALRYLNIQVRKGKLNMPDSKVYFVHKWLKRFWILANTDLFYPLTFYPLYLTVGPWSVGELIEGHIGILFAWGTFINGTYLPGAFTYAYGFSELFFFQGPLIVLLAYNLELRLRESGRSWIASILFAGLLTTQLVLAYCFWLAYGSMALLFGPFRIFPLVMVIATWCRSHSIPLSKLRKISSTWVQKNKLGLSGGHGCH